MAGWWIILTDHPLTNLQRMILKVAEKLRLVQSFSSRNWIPIGQYQLHLGRLASYIVIRVEMNLTIVHVNSAFCGLEKLLSLVNWLLAHNEYNIS